MLTDVLPVHSIGKSEIPAYSLCPVFTHDLETDNITVSKANGFDDVARSKVKLDPMFVLLQSEHKIDYDRASFTVDTSVKEVYALTKDNVEFLAQRISSALQFKGDKEKAIQLVAYLRGKFGTDLKEFPEINDLATNLYSKVEAWNEEKINKV